MIDDHTNLKTKSVRVTFSSIWDTFVVGEPFDIFDHMKPPYLTIRVCLKE